MKDGDSLFQNDDLNAHLTSPERDSDTGHKGALSPVSWLGRGEFRCV